MCEAGLGSRPPRSLPRAPETSGRRTASSANRSTGRSSSGRDAGFPGSHRSPASTTRSRSYGWPSTTPTAPSWREGDAGAVRDGLPDERITRSTCRAVAEYAFRAAERSRARVYGGPKWTVSPVYEGMLKEEMDAAAARHPELGYQPVLIDATYAGLLSGATDAPLVIPALNRDGDCLSDLVLPMFGSIAGAESVLLAFDERLRDERRDGRGAPWHRTGARGQGFGEPAGHDPRLWRDAQTRGRPPRAAPPSAPRGPSTKPRSRRSDRVSRRPTSAATPPRPNSPPR